MMENAFLLRKDLLATADAGPQGVRTRQHLLRQPPHAPPPYRLTSRPPITGKHKNNRLSGRNTNGQSLNTPNTDEQPSNIVSPPIESEGVLVISAWTRDGREIRRRLHG